MSITFCRIGIGKRNHEYQNLFTEKEIEVFCRRHVIRRLSLFGSVLRDDFGPESDVESLLVFSIKRPPLPSSPSREESILPIALFVNKRLGRTMLSWKSPTVGGAGTTLLRTTGCGFSAI